ncbi:MAG: hypothetical protein WB699_06335 [Bacteroidota bacterium]
MPHAGTVTSNQSAGEEIQSCERVVLNYRRRTYYLLLKRAFPILVTVVLVLNAGILLAQTSPHGELPIACARCHSTTAWKPVRSPLLFDHDSTGFPLVAQHASVACAQCHKGLVFAKAPTQCAQCHEDVHRGELGTLCERCHTSQSWLVPDMRQRHAQTRFTLMGAHMTAPCQACHVNQQKFEYVNVPIDCYGCHRVQYEATTVPAHRAAGFGTNCIQCHSPNALAWPANFDHNATGFALVGAHATTPCVQCHAGGQFKNAPTQCDNCHHAQFMATTSPAHASSGFSTACQSCHTSVSWQPATFNHSKTNFPLTGAHASVQCADCHKNNQYTAIPTTCVSCHQADFTATNNPPHVSGGFSQQCETCHTNVAWQPAIFDHAKSSFPLTGAHAAVACASCHKNNQFSGTPTACVSCHQTDFTSAANPPHASAGFPNDCTTCHTTTAWQPSTFDHNKTNFPLTGAHAAVTPCASCHKTTPWSAQATACVSCHQADFNATNNPPHVSGGFPTDCTTCHTTTAWQPATFDHSKSSFPLTGAHVSVPCASCHTNNNFTTVPTTCVGCHQQNFNTASNPPHSTGGFSTDCTTCHNTVAWQPSTFDHNKTNFPLTGAHAAVTPCASCHKTTPWSAQATACVSCHQADFNATNNPPHVSGGFPTDCTTCHTTTAWQPATFDHSKTNFPLTGAHAAVPCASCHTNNNYTSVPTACASCHQSDFTSAANPPHASAGFPNDCTTCHTTTAWQPSTFDHSKTNFPLTGAHAAVTPCTGCHTVSPWSAQATTCVSCHQTDYNNTTNPAHASAGFPTTCQTCHTTTAWTGATFNHTWFPTNHGNAGGTCATCHSNPNDYSVFSCIDCHEHSQANTDPHHTGVSGYSYNSAACYRCHPQGRGG